MKTEITNKFTGYSATINTKSLPAISTIKRHLRVAKHSECKSETVIRIDGVRYSIERPIRDEVLVASTY